MVRGLSKLVAVVLCLSMMNGAILFLPRTSITSEAALAAPVTLTIGVPQTIDNLNPLVGYQNIAYQCYVLQYDYLVAVDKDFNPTPGAALSWNHSVDGLVWTFNIRHGMTFHDGVPVTAQDVNWTYNLVLKDPAAGSLYVDYLRNVTYVRAIDDYTLQITSNAPKANMLSILIPIMPMHLWMNVPANKITSVDLWDPTYFPNGPVGSGPFRLLEYVTDNYVRFAKYDGYYRGTVHFDELIYKIYLSPVVMLNALNAGTIDLACMVPKESWANTIAQPDIDGQTVRDIVLHELGFNVCPPDLRVGGASTNYETLNRSVRKAVAMAIDKNEIVEKVLYGQGEPGDVLIAPSDVMWHCNLTEQETVKFDIAAANDLLNKSNYIDSDGDGIRENQTNKKELNFVFNYATEYPDDEASARRIHDWLLQIGISADPIGELESKLYSDWIGMKYDMFIWNWGGDVDPTFMLSVLTTAQIPGGHNDWSAWSDSFYSNPVYDDLFIEQQITTNISERQQIVFEMQRILYHDNPYIILQYPFSLYAYRTDRFTNWPDMESHPGESPMTGTTGGPWMFFEILPISSNLPPQVSPISSTTAALNETKIFSGSAIDEDPASLTWTWQFIEPNGTTNVETGKTVTYTFLNLGIVEVRLNVTDNVGQSTVISFTVTVEVVEHAGWVVGHVNDSLGHSIAAAEVSAGAAIAMTNDAGYYNITLSAGTYNVTASAVGYSSESFTVSVVENQTTLQDFVLVGTSGTLTGHVYDAKSDAPLENVTISVRLGDLNRLAVTNSSGGYQFAQLPQGTYGVNASKPDYETNSTSAVVTAGNVTVLDIQLSPVSGGGHGGKGLSTEALAVIGIVIAAVIIASVALLLMRRNRAGTPPAPPEQPRP